MYVFIRTDTEDLWARRVYTTQADRSPPLIYDKWWSSAFIIEIRTHIHVHASNAVNLTPQPYYKERQLIKDDVYNFEMWTNNVYFVFSSQFYFASNFMEIDGWGDLLHF